MQKQRRGKVLRSEPLFAEALERGFDERFAQRGNLRIVAKPAHRACLSVRRQFWSRENPAASGTPRLRLERLRLLRNKRRAPEYQD